MHDIIDREKTELLQLNADLEQHLHERTAELDIARNELSSFIYSVSHDLQAPLRRILGFAGILEECAERLGEEGRQHLARIVAATSGMEQLIASLLELSRVTRAEIRRVPADLGALAQGGWSTVDDSDASVGVQHYADHINAFPGRSFVTPPIIAKSSLKPLSPSINPSQECIRGVSIKLSPDL